MFKKVFTAPKFFRTKFKIEFLLPVAVSREVLGIIPAWWIRSVVSEDLIAKSGNV